MKKVLLTGGSGFIGSYLIEQLLKSGGYEIINIDPAEPIEKEQFRFWERGDVVDRTKILEIFRKFAPQYVIHLAARTDTPPENVLDDYKTNTDGTANVLEAIKASKSVERVVITSTQFVHQRHGTPTHDEDFAPHTVYGESKVISEKLTRQAQLDCCWTIIRPTNVWGPRHPRYAQEFWKVLRKGRYIHPGKKPVIRSYGFVGNVVDQIIQILYKDPSLVNKQVFYVGDEPMNIYDWANGFSVALNGRNVRTVPRVVVKSLAIVGDLLRIFRIPFPITTSRYHSMTEDNPVPMAKTIKVLGQPKHSFQEGVNETVSWLRQQDNFWGSES